MKRSSRPTGAPETTDWIQSPTNLPSTAMEMRRTSPTTLRATICQVGMVELRDKKGAVVYVRFNGEAEL